MGLYIRILKIVTKFVGCPAVLRCDYGTENSDIAAVQIGLRYFHEDGLARERSFIYGPSKFNIIHYACIYIAIK